MSDRERVIYETLTDEDLTMPVGEMPPGKIAVLQHVLEGPYGEELMERIKSLMADTVGCNRPATCRLPDRGGPMSNETLDEFIHQTSVRIGNAEADVIEKRIRLVLQDKPWWLPEWLWLRVVKRLIRIEVQL